MTTVTMITAYFVKSLWAIIPVVAVMVGGAIYEHRQK